MKALRIVAGITLIIIGVGVLAFEAIFIWPMLLLTWPIGVALIGAGAALTGFSWESKQEPDRGTMPKGWKPKEDQNASKP